MCYTRIMAYKDKNDPRLKAARLRHYYKNKEQYLERNKVARANIKDLVDSYKNKPCVDCGVSYPPYIMQFDHVNQDKEYNVSSLIRHNNVDKIKKEIAKCEVVCANCHAERTHRRLVQK